MNSIWKSWGKLSSLDIFLYKSNGCEKQEIPNAHQDSHYGDHF